MTLHQSKNSAILQWFNSLCSYDVASVKQLHDGKLFCDVINSVFHACFEGSKITRDPVENLKDEKFTEPKEISIQTSASSNDCNVTLQRYRFLQDFIDDQYHIKSCDLIAYEDCMISKELELAKVAVFILTLIVKHFLESNNEQVNTLTLLDSRVQEDIQECLSVLFQSVDKLSKIEMERILSKEAKYKVSPSKRSSVSTPRRCSSKYKKSVVEEEIFNFSPLKSFLESPQFCNQSFHAKEEELKKTRKILQAEEVKVEYLECEIDHLKKKLKEQDIKIRDLKNSARLRKSKERDDDHHEHHECETCQDWKERMKSSNEQIKKLEDEIKSSKSDQEKMEEKHTAEVVSLKTMLEGRRKYEDDRDEERVKLKTIIALKDNLLQQAQEAYKKLKDELHELRLSHQKDMSLFEEKLADTKFATGKSLDTPVKGEIIGTVIEGENKALQIELDKAKEQIQILLSELEAKNEAPYHRIHHENSPAKDHSDVSVAELMNESDIPEAKHQNSVKSESVEANCSSLHAGDISSDLIGTNSDQVVDLCCAEQKKENVPSSECEVSQAPNEGLGSLWANYNDSYSENSEETCSLSNKHGISKSVDLLKQLGFSTAEYTSKMNAVKKLCAALKEVFAPNGSNGFVGSRTVGSWEKNIESDEDQLLCLLYIKDSLVKFQNKNSLSKDTDMLCSCDNTYAVAFNQLKKENDDLNVKLSELSENLAIEMQKKKQELEALVGLKKENEELDAKWSAISAKYKDVMETKVLEIGELSKELKTTKQLYKVAVTSKEKQFKEMSKENEGLKLQLENMSQKILTTDKNYAKIANEKNELTEKYNKRIHLLREKTFEFDKVRKELEQAIEYEKRKKIKCRIEYANLEVQIKDLIFENKELQKDFHDLTKKNKQLTSKIKEMESIIAKKAAEDVVAENVPYAIPHSTVLNEDHTRIKEEKENETEEFIMPKTETSDSEISTANQFGDNFKDIKPHDLSTYSGALFGRRSFILPTDDEESYLNHSSIAEINSGKKLRLKELQRRNSIVPPHMRSSYAPEVQCISPFNRNLFDLVKTHLDNKDCNKIKKNLFSVKKVKPSVLTGSKKKRKVSELESDNEVNSSKGPDSWKRRMRNQSNFMKVLYRGSQNSKAKQLL